MQTFLVVFPPPNFCIQVNSTRSLGALGSEVIAPVCRVGEARVKVLDAPICAQMLFTTTEGAARQQQGVRTQLAAFMQPGGPKMGEFLEEVMGFAFPRLLQLQQGAYEGNIRLTDQALMNELHAQEESFPDYIEGHIAPEEVREATKAYDDLGGAEGDEVFPAAAAATPSPAVPTAASSAGEEEPEPGAGDAEENFPLAASPRRQEESESGAEENGAEAGGEPPAENGADEGKDEPPGEE